MHVHRGGTLKVSATQFIRRMRGGAQGHLMLCDDGRAYVVKFQNNPQFLRVLANEWLATLLARALGLPVPPCSIVHVDNRLIELTPDLRVDHGLYQSPCKPGLQFGSQLIGGLMPGKTLDYLPDKQLSEISNMEDFAGILAFDKWTCNSDGRQAVFHRDRIVKRYKASFIDQGYCFSEENWRFVDAPLRGVYARNLVYRNVTGWQSFEPWLTRIEEIESERILNIMATIPFEWFERDEIALAILAERLMERRFGVRELITQFRKSSREPFPNWRA
jgi:hypothetical protein